MYPVTSRRAKDVAVASAYEACDWSLWVWLSCKEPKTETMNYWTKLCLSDLADKSLFWQLLEMPKVYKASLSLR